MASRVSSRAASPSPARAAMSLTSKYISSKFASVNRDMILRHSNADVQWKNPKNASFSSVSAACHVCQTLLRRPGQPLKWSSNLLFSCYSIFVYYIQCSRAFCQFLFMSYQQHRGINLKKILIKRTGRYTIHNCNCTPSDRNLC